MVKEVPVQIVKEVVKVVYNPVTVIETIIVPVEKIKKVKVERITYKPVEKINEVVIESI